MKKDRSLTIIIWSMLVTAFFAYCLYTTRSTEEPRDWRSKTIVIKTLAQSSFSTEVVTAGFVLCLVGCVACFTLKKEKKWFGVLPAVVLLISPLFAFASAFDGAGALQDTVGLKTSDGQEYHLLISNFLQGSEVVLARLVSRTSSETRFEMLAESGWEKGFGYLTIIRPADLPVQDVNEYGSALYLSPDNILLGVPSGGNTVYVAYDLNTHVAYGQIKNGPDDHHVRDLSSFLMLGASDTPSEEDYKSLPNNSQFGMIDADSWKLELNNKNPKIRELAKRALNISK